MRSGRVGNALVACALHMGVMDKAAACKRWRRFSMAWAFKDERNRG